MQRIMEKAFMARDILQAGRQAPAIAVNRPAQFILQDKMTELDSEFDRLVLITSAQTNDVGYIVQSDGLFQCATRASV